MFFHFPEDARWSADMKAVEFGVGVGEYEGVVRVPRQVFRRFIDGAITPERCLEAFHLQRTRFELIVERKLRNRQLTDDGNIEITDATCGHRGRLMPLRGTRLGTRTSHPGTNCIGCKLAIDDHRRRTPFPGADSAGDTRRRS